MRIPHRPDDPDFFLRRVLQANAVFSTVCGLIWVAGGEPLGHWFGRDSSMASDGLGLLLFAGLLLALSFRTRIPAPLAVAVVVLDIVWVVDACMQVSAGAFSPAGAWTMGIIALVVLDFALFQSLGIRRSLTLRRRAT